MSEPRKYVLEIPAYYKPTLSGHPAYGQWGMMLTRCRNKKATKYCDYGGRGITVCARWEKGENGQTGFECFMQDMGNKPSPSHSLDRIDNDGNYELGNCRWATPQEQARNRRSTHMLTYKGKTMSMLDLSEQTGISYYALRNRINRRWTVEAAVEKPIGFYDFRKIPSGEQLSHKLTADDVRRMRWMHACGIGLRSLSMEFSISKANACLIVNRKTWKHAD